MTISKNKIIHAEYGHIAETLKRLELIATKDLTDCPVLFTGPTGSGKEMLADYLVEHIPDNPQCTKINCIGLPEQIIESELFGHEKGAFTGAAKDRTGLIEESEGGILFLDEIGILSKPLQAKLLRVLEDRKIRKIGGSGSEEINVRFIAATNCDLIPDLKHRFPYKIHIPPINEIPEEIPYLLKYFLRDSAFRLITLGTLLSMAHMEWEGNVRELKNFLKEAEISLELFNRNVGRKTAETVVRGKLFDMPFLFDWVRPPLERYWAIRKFTTFDELVLKIDRGILKKVKFAPEHNMYETALRFEKEGGHKLISINRTTGKKYPFRIAREDELCLQLNENFPVNASKMIRLWANLLDEDTEKRLEYLINNPQDFPAQKTGLFPGIRLNIGLRNMPNGQTKPPVFSELSWENAKEEFGKTYWKDLHTNNPRLQNKEYTKMMGISPQHYQTLKRKFNKNASKANKNETIG